jgi:hypothetical protein
MELSNEDNLRLNVLLRQNLKAVRVDESRMIVYGLTDKGEAKIQLNPTCKEEPYLRLVREVFSTYILGSPGGYPVYIRRWTRMGQARDEDSLENLLLLGEPEAVTAVVHAPELSPEIAANAWWAYPSAENARQLLATPAIANSHLGPELAQYLLEFLPFEEEAQAQIDSIRLILQPGLIDDATVTKLWKNARRKQNYYIGFLHTRPHTLPDADTPHPLFQEVAGSLDALATEHACAKQLQHCLGASGQRFLKTAESVINKASNQDTVVELMTAISHYHANIRPDDERYRRIEAITERTQSSDIDVFIAPVIEQLPMLEPQLRAMIGLSLVSEYLVAPVFGRTDAIGTVMRRKLEPVTTPLLSIMQTLNPTIAVK